MSDYREKMIDRLVKSKGFPLRFAGGSGGDIDIPPGTITDLSEIFREAERRLEFNGVAQNERH